MNDTNGITRFKELIQNHCGMVISDIHSQQLEKYIRDALAASGKSCDELYDAVLCDHAAMIDLINAVAVNETYFFREERQFQFLKECLINNFMGKDVVIWSAASSSGEEAYSLASLACACGARPVVYATDIDTDALLQLKTGVYGYNSFRNDGKGFRQYIDRFLDKAEDGNGKVVYAVRPELKEKIICGRANLLDMDSYPCVPKPDTVDIIFIRNVFIYFDQKARDKILRNLSLRLKKNGLLFFSMSEIAGINPDDGSLCLVKKTKDSVFYFCKEAEPAAYVSNSCCRKVECTSSGKPADEFGQKKDSILERLNMRTAENEKIGLTAARREEKPAVYSSPEEFWKEMTSLADRKKYSEAMALAESYSPAINAMYIKYYAIGTIHSDTGDEAAAIGSFQRAGMANPHFWPAFYQISVLLMGKQDSSSRKKRYEALVKAATILENEKIESEKYNYITGTFSAGYFYRICNEHLKKEFS